jgi:hypothetical protein
VRRISFNKDTYPMEKKGKNSLIREMRSGKLEFVHEFPIRIPNKAGERRRLLWCLCDCGMGKLVEYYNFTRGYSKSCGHCCKIKHNGNGTPEYAAYHNAKQRCYNPRCSDYPEYGGRGIFMDSWWLVEDGYVHFFEDMGPRPSGEHSLGRIDNDGPYGWMYIFLDDECTRGVWVLNCRWETPKEQAQNRRPKNLSTEEGPIVLKVNGKDVALPDRHPF